jgi:DNA-binding CsgD family transcriptional regulator/PAS domain-containing protein
MVISNIPSAYRPAMAQYPEEVLQLWGGPAVVAGMPLEEPVIQSHMTDPADWAENAYFREFSIPQGIIDAVGVALARDSTLIATIVFGRHGSEGPIGEIEVEALRVLAPHVRRATTISGMLDNAMAREQTFAAALEASPVGIVLVDPQMHIVHANRIADEMLATEDPVRRRGGVLSLVAEVLPGLLESAVTAAANDDPEGRRGLGVPSRRRDGTPLVLRVLPLTRRSMRGGIEPRASAAIFIGEAPGALQLPGDALALIYSLTPAEVRVLELIAEGSSLAEVSDRLGKSSHTVRTHLNRVFDKTGVHRQADLVRLLSTITLPV